MRIDILNHTRDASERLTHFIESKSAESIERFEDHIDHATVTVRDVNGPRRGIDVMCQISINMGSMGTVVVHTTADGVYKSLNHCLEQAARGIQRRLDRRRDRRHHNRRELMVVAE
ncbi:MAG: hypothetical protein CMJ78_23400 [Planctomycetaceae bacterium]|nr:hypothetical protein [Planctomycetaceae bacterium]